MNNLTENISQFWLIVHLIIGISQTFPVFIKSLRYALDPTGVHENVDTGFYGDTLAWKGTLPEAYNMSLL